MKYYFEWDPNKAKENSTKHKVSFEQATTIFLDSNAISIFDKNHSEIEERWITIGIDKNGVLLIVIHTFKEVEDNLCIIRIISARKATKKEINQYNEEIL